MLLAIETSQQALGAALVDEGEVLSLFELNEAKPPHAMFLPKAVQSVLRKADCRMDALKAIGLDIGPGSFTGLRIGTAFAKAMAVALGVPIVPVLAVDAIAQAVPPGANSLWVLLDAKRGNVYAAEYLAERGIYSRLAEVRLAPLDSLLPEIAPASWLAGDLPEALWERLLTKKQVRRLDPALGAPAAAAVGREAWRRYQAGELCEPGQVSPLYLYPKDCSVGPEMKERIRKAQSQ